MKKAISKFTLIELMVVITILIILATLMMPALYQAKWYGFVAACKSNLRQHATGLNNYAIDHKRWYPDGGYAGMGGAGIGSYKLGRVTWWGYPDYPYTREWARYYRMPKFNDSRDLTFKNDLFRCPGGMREVHWNIDTGAGIHGRSATFYSHNINAYHGATSRVKHDGVNQPYVYADPHRVLRKMGQKMTFTAYNWWGISYPHPSEGRSDLQYDVVGMDFGARGGNWIVTNHLWGGDRKYTGHSSYIPLGWYSSSGKPTINYAFTDGSVKDFTIPSSNVNIWRNYMNINGAMTGVASAGSAHLMPKQWGEDTYGRWGDI